VDEVLLDIADGIATVTLNRPAALNSFTDAMEASLLDVLERCDRDDNVRVVILTGAGRAFCSGMDLGDSDATFESWRTSADAPPGTQFDAGEEFPVRRDGGGRVVLALFALNKPVIAAVNGHAVGVGITMTLPADIRILADDAKIGFVFTRPGLVPESCSSWFLPRVVPMQTALEWMLTGRIVTAAEALERGLARSIHPAGEVLEVARGLAREIADNTAPVSVAVARRSMWQLLGALHPMVAHEFETLALNARGLSADAGEGIVAFLDKRRPDFPDLVSRDLPDVMRTLADPEYAAPTAVRP
jgi:enoyl-CoA hydratase/carnithine racemase